MSPTRGGVTRLSDKPGKVDLNLDTLDLEAAAPPFTFVAGGQRFVVENIEERDWQDLMDFDATDAEATLKMILGEDQYVAIPRRAWYLDAQDQAVAQGHPGALRAR